MSMNFRGRLGIGFSITALLFLGALLYIGLSFYELANGVRQIKEETLPYILIIDEMDTQRADVQQYLTDVSATHKREGYKPAEAAAKGFLLGAEKYKQLYRRKGDAVNLEKMQRIEADFNHLYETGRTMAEAYIAEGLLAGNLVMEKFDKDSEALGVGLKVFREQQVAEAGRITTAVSERADSLLILMAELALAAFLLAVGFATWMVTRKVA